MSPTHSPVLPAPGAWFIPQFISLARVASSPVKPYSAELKNMIVWDWMFVWSFGCCFATVNFLCGFIYIWIRQFSFLYSPSLSLFPPPPLPSRIPPSHPLPQFYSFVSPWPVIWSIEPCLPIPVCCFHTHRMLGVVGLIVNDWYYWWQVFIAATTVIITTTVSLSPTSVLILW